MASQPHLFPGLSPPESQGSDSESDGSDVEWKVRYWYDSLRLTEAKPPHRKLRNAKGRYRPPERSSGLLPTRRVSASDYLRDLRRCGSRYGFHNISALSRKLQSLDPTDEDDDTKDVGPPRENSYETTGVVLCSPGNTEDMELNASVNPEVSQESAYRDLTVTTRPDFGENCDVCYKASFDIFRAIGHKESGWQSFSSFSSSAQTGQRCCNMVVNAIKSWLLCTDQEVQHTLNLTSDLLFDTMEVCIDSFSFSHLDDGRGRELRPRLRLRWTGDIHGEEHAELGRYSIIVFEPHDAHPQPPDLALDHKFSRRFLPSGDTSSPQAFSTLGNWLETCTRSHERCNSGPLHYVPKRVLEITHQSIFLRERPSNCSRYACLSHCWGASGVAYKLTSATIDTLKHGIDLESFPKTFRDAARICSRLQISHIWIDALCILQDDDDDWDEAVGTMADIYENSFLTIAATASPDSNGGCFSDPNSIYRARKLHESCLHVAQEHRLDFNTECDMIRGLESWPLMKRAWVFQERTLSPRIVHFTDTQLLWECRSMMKSESGDIDLDWTDRDLEDSNWRYRKATPFKYQISDTANDWHHVVMDYSSLNLTFCKDRLPALSAIVQRMLKTRKNDTYINGLWSSTLLQDLHWRGDFGEKVSRPTVRAPTWSWASVTGGVMYDEYAPYKKHWAFSAEISHDSRASLDPSYINDAKILLRCHSCTGRITLPNKEFECDPYHFYPGETESSLPLPYHWGMDRIDWEVCRDYDLSTGDRPVRENDTVVVAMTSCIDVDVARWGGLVLRQVSEHDYERIGLCYMPDMVTLSRRVLRKARWKDNLAWRYDRHFVASLPVRSFKIL